MHMGENKKGGYIEGDMEGGRKRYKFIGSMEICDQT